MTVAEKMIRQFVVPGVVVSAQVPDDLFAIAMESASAPAVMTDGKPTIMLVEAWMLHEGKNKNGDVFREEDLVGIAQQVVEPNFLPMDWNHSTRYGEGETIGVWYRAERAWNDKAKDGKGAWGVKAYGMLWAWAYPVYVQSLLADMERDGSAAFSMMCIPKDVTFGRDAEGYFSVMIEPTMYALSALSVAPGDPDAVGVAVEGAAGEELSKKLDERVRRWQAAAVELFAPFAMATRNTDPQGATEMKTAEELKAEAEALAAEQALKAEQDLAAAEAETTTEAAPETPAEPAPEAPAAEATTEAAADAPAPVQSVEDLQVALEALTNSFKELQAQYDAQSETLAELNAKLEASAADAAQAAFEETRDARYEALPAPYRKVLEGRGEPVVAKFKERWATASAEEWDTFLEDISLANPAFRQSYREMSEKEGGLLQVPVSDEENSIAALVEKART